MIWDVEKEPAEGEAVNETTKAENQERAGLRDWFIALSDLRGKERSLLHGDYYSLHASAASLAFLRVWDQSERYVTAVNWGTAPERLALKAPSEGECRETHVWFAWLQSFKRSVSVPAEVKLPEMAKVKMSTDENFKEESSVSLQELTVAPGQALLLQFPYSV